MKSSILTLLVPLLTKTEFLLTLSVWYQADKEWEYRKISIRELMVLSNSKFYKLTSLKLYDRQ